MSCYQAVCFDLFDTIVTFDSMIYSSIRREGLNSFGVDAEEFSKIWDESSDEALGGKFQMISDRYRHALSLMTEAEKARNILDDLVEIEKMALRSAVQPVPGITEIFKILLAKRKRLAIVSNSSCTGSLVLELLNWNNFFDELIFSYLEKVFKPNPEIFLLTCDKLGLPANYVAFVSDGDRGDLTGATIAGLDAIRFDPTRSYQDQYLPPGCYDCLCTETLKNRLLI